MYFYVVSVKEKPTLRYTCPFILFWFYLVMPCVNGQNILWKINECVVSKALWRSDKKKQMSLNKHNGMIPKKNKPFLVAYFVSDDALPCKYFDERVTCSK
jgi:hypothetical protein